MSEVAKFHMLQVLTARFILVEMCAKAHNAIQKQRLRAEESPSARSLLILNHRDLILLDGEQRELHVVELDAFDVPVTIQDRAGFQMPFDESSVLPAIVLVSDTAIAVAIVGVTGWRRGAGGREPRTAIAIADPQSAARGLGTLESFMPVPTLTVVGAPGPLEPLAGAL